MRIRYLSILGKEWSVFWYSRKLLTELHTGEDNWGKCHAAKRYIEILTQLDALENLDTLMHEIGHAIWYEFKRGEDETEENAVNVLASGFTRVLADNPKLQQYIKKHTQ